MGRALNRLSATQVRAINAPGYFADGGNLFLQVSAFGTKSWLFRFTRAGKTREMGLGALADVSLAEARQKASEVRKMLRDGVDPIEQRKAARSLMVATSATALTFEQTAKAFIKAKESEWKNAKHGAQWHYTLEQFAYPIIGKVLVRDVTQAHILKIIEPIWTTKTETASRLRGRLENVLDYAIARGYRTDSNPAKWKGYLDKLLPTPSKVSKVVHHKALSYQAVGTFMADLRKHVGMGTRALEFAILTVARSGEVRGATWEEIDLGNAVWTIPAARMKADKEHRIPLSDAALELLNTLPRIDGSTVVFPNMKGGILSDMTMTATLKRMAVDVTAHGFRSTFRDWAGETTAYPREVIEHALAHQLADKAEAAYARGTLFDKRRSLMESWAKHCAVVSTTASVTPINRGATS
jgi:integrase